MVLFSLALTVAALLGTSTPEIDLLNIPHLTSKGRIQDRHYQPSIPVIDSIIRTGKDSIPILISLLESERRYSAPPIDFWPEMTEGDMALVVLTDLFLDPTWKLSTAPEVCWDNLLGRRPDEKIGAWDLLYRYVEANGRAGLVEQWGAVWTEYSEQIVWDETGRFFRITTRQLRSCE